MARGAELLVSNITGWDRRVNSTEYIGGSAVASGPVGSARFLARELARSLSLQKIDVHAVGSQKVDLSATGASDGLRLELRPDDAIVMLAALTPEKDRDIGTMMRNLRMAESVAQAISLTPPAQFLYVSSDAVYDAKASMLFDEQTPCEPSDLYGLMHLTRERTLEQSCSTHSIPFGIIRPCAIYGHGDTHNSYGPNRFLRAARQNGKITLFGNGEQKRHHACVTDIAGLIVSCIVRGSTGVLNAAFGKAISFGDVAEMVLSIAGPGTTIERLPRATPVAHRHFDSSALARAFPDFTPLPLEMGLRQTMEGLS